MSAFPNWKSHNHLFFMEIKSSLIGFVALVLAGALSVEGQSLKLQDYPIYHLDPLTYSLHGQGDPVPVTCIKRQIDTGEHIFDKETGDIIYGPFPKCLETNKPLALEFGVDSVRECTVEMDDELFHMFQLYLHKDVPWTCRLEARKESGVYIPMDISLRGTVMESHVDLDSNINVVLMSDSAQEGSGEIIAAGAWSSSRSTSKVIIGDTVKLRFNINWANQLKGANLVALDTENIPQDNGDLVEQSVGVMWLAPLRNKNLFDSTFSTIGCFLAALALGALMGVFASYKRLGRKIQASSDDWMNKVE